jgi:hypothetical protein
MPGPDFAEPIGKREKEEKTQEYLLKKLFGDLYNTLNLSQFVIDKEKGTVDIPKLEAYLREKGFSEDAIKEVKNYLEGKTEDWEHVQSQIALEYEQIQTIDKGLTGLGITLTDEQRMDLILQILSHEVNISDGVPLKIWIAVGKGEGFGNEKMIEIELTDEMEKAVYIRNHSEEIVKLKEKSNSVEEFDKQIFPELRDDESLHQWFFGSKISECTSKGDFKGAQTWKGEAGEWAQEHGYNAAEFMRGVYEQFKLIGGSDVEWLSASVGFDISKVEAVNAEKVSSLIVSFVEFAEENEKFKQWIEENVNMVELEKVKNELMEKGLEKSSEETKKVIEDVVKALDEIIEKTVDEEVKRIVEIMKEWLEKGVEEKSE